MDLSKPRKPMTKFKKVDYGRYLKLVTEAEQGKNARQRLRDVHLGAILRQCTLRGAVSAYSALQALRFMAFDEYRKKMQKISVERENPYAGTPFDFPESEHPLVSKKSEPTPEELRLLTRELAAKYVLIPEADWEAMLEMGLITVEPFRRAQLQRKGKQAKKEKQRIRGGATPLSRRCFGEPTDEAVIQQLLDEAWEEYRQPPLMIRDDVDSPCGCIPFAFTDPPKPLIDRPRSMSPKRSGRSRVRRPVKSRTQLSLF